MEKRCVIIGAIPLGRPGLAEKYIKEDDFLIYCDAGLYNIDAVGRGPDLVVGDFDSHPPGDFNAETITLPHIKDDTDTAYAVKEALKRGYDSFLFLGCIGKRLDHTMGNLSILLSLDEMGKNAVMVDDYSEMQILSSTPLTITDDFPYFSLVNIDGEASGIDISDAFYPLENATFKPGFSLGVSNEPLPGKTATVSCKRGRLLLMRIFDP